jgi:hypothetical protein
MKIHQIQMAFDKVQDRVLMRLSTTDKAEFRFWLTRHYVKRLWEVLLKMIERDPSTAAYKDESVRRAMIEFQHENIVRGGEFSKKFEEGSGSMPLGDAPLLLSRIAGKQSVDGAQVLCMHPENGQGIDLAVNAQLLHMISKLISDAVVRSDWDLTFAIDPNMAVASSAQAVPPHRLN